MEKKLTLEQKKQKVQDFRPIDDGTDIADLMSCFTQMQVNNPKFPVFTSRMYKLKNEEGGLNIMCEVMQKYEQIAAKKELRQSRI